MRCMAPVESPKSSGRYVLESVNGVPPARRRAGNDQATVQPATVPLFVLIDEGAHPPCGSPWRVLRYTMYMRPPASPRRGCSLSTSPSSTWWVTAVSVDHVAPPSQLMTWWIIPEDPEVSALV